jgi:hypothetical protein
MNSVPVPAIFLVPLAIWSGLAAANPAKVAEYLNKGSQTPIVEVRNGALVAPQAQSKNIAGHYIEDCRKGAIRQALMDASATADGVVELSRKGSHRMKLTGRETENDDVGALVGVRLIVKGTAIEKTFSYLMDDPSNGTCSIVAVDAPVDGMISRKKQEEKVLTQILPKYPAAQMKVIRESYSKGETATDEKIAKKSVSKLIEWECEQYSINQSAALARAAFQSKYAGVQPILFLDYANSAVQSDITYKNKDAELKKMTGTWALRLSDASGTKTMSVKVSFDLNEGEDSCTGSVNPKAEVAE